MWKHIEAEYPPENTPVITKTYLGFCLMKWVATDFGRQWLALFGNYITVDTKYFPIYWCHIPTFEEPK